MLIHYVEFFYPGIFMSETNTKQVKDRTPIKKEKAPAGCYGYRFFDREEKQDKEEILLGKNKNHSGMTYFGKVYTLTEVKKMAKEKDMGCLVSNMESNDWPKVVQTIRGNWQPLEKGDTVI
jgi:hypothetical protein